MLFLLQKLRKNITFRLIILKNCSKNVLERFHGARAGVRNFKEFLQPFAMSLGRCLPIGFWALRSTFDIKVF